jgi:hypothetical protein
MRMRSAVRALVLVSLGLALMTSRATADEPAATWPAGCPSRVQPPPLSLEAGRDARRRAERRHELRLREAAMPGSFLKDANAALDPARLAAGKLCLAEVADLGQLVFEHEYGYADGLGGGKSAKAAAGPFRRVHAGAFGGPETVACTSCHWVGGPNGAGAETDNAFLLGDGERVSSADQRNPPALLALGVVQALAREASRDLQRQRDDLVAQATTAGEARETRLVTKGVDFGVLRVSTKGIVDSSSIEGVDADLVVRPFGWKGTLATIADFATDALQVHLGIQNDVLLANGDAGSFGAGTDPADRDADGMRGEIGGGPFTAMIAHLALSEMPIVEPLIQIRQLPPASAQMMAPTTTSFAEDFQRGRQQFHRLGCAGCHVPMMVLKDPTLVIDGVPPIDLARDMRQPELTYDPTVQGYPVWLFSDLKRHDMGKSNVAKHMQRGVALERYLTPRLWGVADSAPYLHDGRAPSFDYAIAGHDGEGAAARQAFVASTPEDKAGLRVYLMSLHRAQRVIVP